MATIVGTTGDDAQIFDQPNQSNTFFGDRAGNLFGLGGNDRIFGRDGDDALIGDANFIGENGRGGNDLLFGGNGSDSIYGDARHELRGIGGADVLIAGPRGSTGQELFGDAFDLLPGARGGNDRLEGGDEMAGDAVDMNGAIGGRDIVDGRDNVLGSDVRLFGDALGTMSGASRGGNDQLFAGARGSRLAGDAANMSGTTLGGDDTLDGGSGPDKIHGDALATMSGASRGGDDVLRGRAGNDELIGDAQQRTGTSRGGDDHLYGGTGDDRLYGDFASGGSGPGGADVFHFAGSFGADKILDYEDGRDQIMFKDYIRIDLDVDVVGGNTVISAIGGDSVTVLDFTGKLDFGTDIVFGP